MSSSSISPSQPAAGLLCGHMVSHFEVVSTLDPSHLHHWPNPHESESAKAKDHHILILDSSHNPPTTAHAHLITSALASSSSQYTALVLLLATHNADKGHLSARALAHRTHLMHLLAQHLQPSVPTAIATTPCALFADKALALTKYLDARALGGGGGGQARLDWITGQDTLVRVLHPKYYPGHASLRHVLVDGFLAPTHSRLLVAPRPHPPFDGHDVELMHQLYKEGWLVRLDLPDTVEHVASSLVRQARLDQHPDWRAWVVPEVAGYVEAEGLYLPHDLHHAS